MLNSENNSVENAAQARVSARDLTEALASIEIRKARLAYEQAGTVTLGEAAAECSIEATPEEIQAEMERLRAAEAAQERVKRWQRRLRFALGAELVSAALCLLALLGLKHTQFDPSWRQTRQAESFQQMLRQSVGPRAGYQIVVVPNMGASFGDRANHPVYPLYSLPDGYDIHVVDEPIGAAQGLTVPWFMPSQTLYVEFRKAQPAFTQNCVFVYYNGLDYRRRWLPKEDEPNVLHGHQFNLYPSRIQNSISGSADLVPLTVSTPGIESARGIQGFMAGAAGQQYQQIFMFPERNRLSLDSHAWEPYSGAP